MKTIHETNYNGHVNKLRVDDTSAVIEYWRHGNLIYDGIEYGRDELIDMALAVLAFYGETE